ncbi:MAG: sulfatase-like hydrolase/transferase [Actinomycetota bacterium]
MKRLVVHPFLIAAYPVLFLFAQNIEKQVTLGTVVAPLVAVLAGTAGLLVVARVVAGDWVRAGLVTSLLVFLFFAYGPVADLLANSGMAVGPATLVAIWAVVAVIGVVLAVRSGEGGRRLSSVLNLIAAVLVALNVVPIVAYAVREPPAPAPARRAGGLPAWTSFDGAKRDIYYLVFDRYARADTLAELYDFDNTEMLTFLEREGFFVASDSVANYPRTAHSLASSLNMTTLDYLSEQMKDDPSEHGPIYDLLRGSKVARYLQAMGYRYVHIGSFWGPTSKDPSADENLSYGALSEFSSVLLDTTVWEPISDWLGRLDRSFDLRADHLGRINFQFESLARIAQDDRPTFAFAHFTLPHPPYVVDADGDYVTREEASAHPRAYNYLQQLAYANTRIQELVTELLAVSEEDRPIIVIQSDEGPHPLEFERDIEGFKWTEASDIQLAEKMRILNAYFLPGVDRDRLYPSITPVNTFRLIFDLYFGADLPLLYDRAWVYEGVRDLYDFTDVTDRLRPDARSARDRARTTS